MNTFVLLLGEHLLKTSPDDFNGQTGLRTITLDFSVRRGHTLLFKFIGVSFFVICD